jgi:hypothetical protein
VVLVALYRLDSDVDDYSGNGYNLTANGGPAYTTGRVVNGITLDSTPKYLNRALTTEFDGLTDISVSFYAKFNTLPASGNFDHFTELLDGANVAWRGYLWNNSGNYVLYFRVEDSGGTQVIISLDLTAGGFTWHTDSNFHNFVFTYDATAGDLTLYVDGTQRAQTTGGAVTALRPNPDSFLIGRNNSATFDGVMDHFGIYNHVLDAGEIDRHNQFTGKLYASVGGIDYSIRTYDWIIEKESLYFPGQFQLFVHDADNTLRDIFERFKEVKIWEDGTQVFTGICVDVIKPKDNTKNIQLFGYDWSWLIHKEPVLNKYTSQTRSAMITSIVNNELSDFGFGTSKITATTEVVASFVANHLQAGTIFTQFAEKEDFWWYVDEVKDIVFKGKNVDDSGVHLDYANNDIKHHQFEKQGGDIVSRVYVTGAPGRPPDTDPIGTIVEDDALISKYDNIPLPLVTINKPELTTIAECQEYGEYEIKRRNQDPDRGTVETSLNTSLDIGELVTLSIAHEGYTSQLFAIQSVYHHFSQDVTRIEVLYFTRNTADLVFNVFDSARRAEFQLTDQSMVWTKIKKYVEELMLTAFVTIDRRSVGEAAYGEFGYGQNYYGQFNVGAWTNVINAQKIVVLNKFLEDFLRLIGQIATVPADISGTNAHIAVGSGTTAIQASDTTLESESGRYSMEPGFPQRITDKQLEFQIIINDVDAVTLTINNVGLFNASASGNLEIAGVLSSSVAKAADEDIRIIIQPVISGDKSTTAGLNAMLDMLINATPDYLDTNAQIQVILDGTPLPDYEEAMASGFPKFITSALDLSRYQIQITTTEIIANSLDGESFTEMDLYNGDPATKTKIVDAVVASATFSQLQDLFAQFDLQVVRG